MGWYSTVRVSCMGWYSTVRVSGKYYCKNMKYRINIYTWLPINFPFLPCTACYQVVKKSRYRLTIRTYTRIGSNDQHGQVWMMCSESKYSSLHVLLVSGKIYESYHLGGLLTDLLCTNARGVIHNLSLGVKAQNLVTDRRSPSRLYLVQVAEEVESSSSPAIVQLSLSEDPQESTLASLHWTEDDQTSVEEGLVVRNLPD